MARVGYGGGLRQLREDRRITLRQFAEHMGWSIPHTSSVELNDAPIPSDDEIRRIADFFNEDAGHLLSCAEMERTLICRNYSIEDFEAAMAQQEKSFDDIESKRFPLGIDIVLRNVVSERNSERWHLGEPEARDVVVLARLMMHLGILMAERRHKNKFLFVDGNCEERWIADCEAGYGDEEPDDESGGMVENTR